MARLGCVLMRSGAIQMCFNAFRMCVSCVLDASSCVLEMCYLFVYVVYLIFTLMGMDSGGLADFIANILSEINIWVLLGPPKSMKIHNIMKLHASTKGDMFVAGRQTLRERPRPLKA